ncbi:MAG: hypothetical protein M5U26_16850 [Planctomycetota bacterium]|nr:hypothetical protein [Planctomycetota bacterium]
MADWLVGGITYLDPVGIADAGGLVSGRYWLGEVRISHPEIEEQFYGFPGVDGVGVKTFGFRGRRLRGGVAYLAASTFDLRAALDADRAALRGVSFSCQAPDGSAYANCRLEALPDGAVLLDAGGLFAMRTELRLFQARE